MSLTTRCPSCETLFKVVPDQLRIADGWVRCGQCDEIFDAALHLLLVPPEPEWPLTQQPESHNTLPTVEVTELPVSEISLVDEGSFAPMIPVAQPDGLDGWDIAVQPVDPLDISSSAVSTITAPELTAHAGREDDDDTFSPGSNEVSFLQDSHRGALWHKPITRAILALLGLVLALGLLGQIGLHERDRIVTLGPGLRPFLLAICAPLNCILSPLRRIESLVIESSSFTRLQGDSYRLNFMLKNTADIPLAMPTIELTLTDSLDQPVVRRVLRLSELGVKSETLTAGAEWPISLALTIKAVGASDPIAGYRLLTFYP